MPLLYHNKKVFATTFLFKKVLTNTRYRGKM
nr:MAG TPA: hypothetical protein [Caudoviricetes sp.]